MPIDELVERLNRAANRGALLMPDAASLIGEAAAAIERLLAERDEARKALRPFADMAGDYDPDDGDGNELAWLEHPKIGDLRRARQALQGKP